MTADRHDIDHTTDPATAVAADMTDVTVGDRVVVFATTDPVSDAGARTNPLIVYHGTVAAVDDYALADGRHRRTLTVDIPVDRTFDVSAAFPPNGTGEHRPRLITPDADHDAESGKGLPVTGVDTDD